MRELPPNTTLVLLTYSGCVSVYRLREAITEGDDDDVAACGGGPPALVAADCYPGHSVPSDAVLKGLFSQVAQYAVPLHSCRATAEAIIMSLRCPFTPPPPHPVSLSTASHCDCYTVQSLCHFQNALLKSSPPPHCSCRIAVCLQTCDRSL